MMQLSEGTAQQLVDQLDHAQDIVSEARILRRIKNDVTGHELRKIAYVRAGLVPVLFEVLSARANSLPNGDSFQRLYPDEEAVWWQGSSIIIVLANAGTAFTYALLNRSLLSLLADRLQVTNPTERVTSNILHCLNTFAENIPFDTGNRWAVDQSLAECLYTTASATCLSRLSALAPRTLQAQQQLRVLLSLICNTCRTEQQILLLHDTGLLDVLCEQLAAQIFPPGPRTPNDQKSIHAAKPREQRTHLALILETIAVIIEHSKSRTEQFVSNEIVERAVIMSIGVPEKRQGVQEQHKTYEFRLPIVPDPLAVHLAKKSSWPPLTHSTDGITAVRRQSSIQACESNSISAQSWISPENTKIQDAAIVSWLLYVVRSAEREVQIMAARLLVILKSYDMLDGRTIRSLATLLVPILVDMLEKYPETTDLHGLYAEQVPTILALLVQDQEHLQQAAVEAKAIPKLAVALKANFESLQGLSSELWWPRKPQAKLTTGSRERSLGPRGPSRPEHLQMMMREGLLKALAALSPDSDMFRKDVCDQGALSHIVLALEPFHSRTISGEHYDRIAISGNSSETLIAACGAVRALTRSPTSLRTKIVDADVAKHVINLLYAAEVAVRLAATKVIANLSHYFSPMREHIGESSVLKKLCQQAHSAHAELRMETLFALKAFINLCPNHLKRTVVEELGTDWIRHLIATDPHDVANGEVIGLVEKDYRKGCMVRISDDADMHDVDPTELERDIERYNNHTLKQDLEILIELLGFMRNLTTGEQPSVIIDFVLDEIGCDEFLQIIVDRLKGITTTYPELSAKIIENCIYVVAHIAIADAKYRSMIARNLVLMKQISALLGHPEKLVRRACCWLVVNVTFSTDESHAVAVARARDFQRLGIVATLRRLEKNDLEADVKERATTACAVFTKLLDKD